MKRYKELYITEILICIIYVLLKFVIVNRYLFLNSYFDAIYFFIIFIYFYFKYGIARDKNYYTKISVRYIIIFLLSYVLIIYGAGLFFGFVNSIYDNSLKGILINTLPVIVSIIFRELVRFIVCYNSKKNIKPIIFLTIIYICFDLFNGVFTSSISSFYNLFQFMCLTVLPSVAKHMLLSYISYKINFIPALVYSLPMEVVPFILPFYPDLGNYLTAVIAILLPFLIYIFLKKMFSYEEKEMAPLNRLLIKVLSMILTMFLIFIVALISGIFKYKMIAIGSDSMNPIYYRGDAIIYEKNTDIKKGDILVFEYNNSIITHRVINIIEEDGTKYFQTKGDNNDNPDLNLTPAEDVLGKVRFIVKYIGFPTIWFSERS